MPAVLKITPALKDNLVGIATAAKAALQGGKLDAAADLIETLDNELQAAPTQAQATPGTDADPAAAAAKAKAIAGKAQMAWGACLKIAAREIDKLRAEVTAAYSDHGFGAQVDTFFRSQVDPALQRLQNNDLAARLAEAAGNADVTAQRQSLAESIRIIESLEGLLATDKVLQKLDANPFTQLVVAKTASATLGTLKKSLQSAAAG
jgi:hypothetical protein